LRNARQFAATPAVGLGTGPFFCEKTHFADKRLAENMDLSPVPQPKGDSPIFAAVKDSRIATLLAPRKSGQSPVIPPACRS
jgi:hypothetical protein